ncbi:hypothetical protein D3C87_1186270 [compost metagenome]
MLARREVAGKLVAAVENAPVHAPFRQVKDRAVEVVLVGSLPRQQDAVVEQVAFFVARRARRRRPGQGRQVVTDQLRESRLAPGFVLAGEAQQGGGDVDRAHHRIRGHAAHAVGVGDEHRDVGLFPIDGAALLAHAVGGGAFAVVRGVDDDGVVHLARVLERPQQGEDVLVHVADAVAVVVDEAQPGGLVLARHGAIGLHVQSRYATMGLGLGRQVVQVEAARQAIAQVGLIQRIARLGAHDPGQVPDGARLGLLAGGVVEHDVVRIDQVHGHEPGLVLTLLGRFGQLLDQHGGVAGDGPVGAVAGPGQADLFPIEVVVREAEGLHRVGGVGELALEARGGRGQLRQVPLALVGRVVARRPHHVAQGVDLGRQDGALFGVGIDLGLLRVLAGVDDGARRGAGRGVHMIVAHVQAALQQGAVAGQVVEEALGIGLQPELLIGDDEEDVQRFRRIAGRARPGAHRRSCGGGADAGHAGQKGTAVDPGHVSTPLRTLPFCAAYGRSVRSGGHLHIAAVEIGEGRQGRGQGDGQDVADDDPVAAMIDHIGLLQMNDSAGVAQEGRAILGGLFPMADGEALAAAHAAAAGARHRLVVGAQHVQHQIRTGVDGLEDGGVAVDADQHGRRVHADLADSGGRHGEGLAVDLGRDYDDRAHQIAQGAFQRGRQIVVHGRRPSL